MTLAAVRLSWTSEQCLEATPSELALQLYAERKRRNYALTQKAWEISWLMSPHVPSKHSSKIAPKRILMSAPGYDPDEEELK